MEGETGNFIESDKLVINEAQLVVAERSYCDCFVMFPCLCRQP